MRSVIFSVYTCRVGAANLRVGCQPDLFHLSQIELHREHASAG